MTIRLLHPLPHTPLRSVLEPLFQNATRVESAVAFVTRPGVRTFLKLVPSDSVRRNSRFVASIRWPTDLDALMQLADKMPGSVYIHRGYFLPEETNHDRSLIHSKTVYIESGESDVHVLVGSHNWTGQALDGNNLEASVHVQCPVSDAFADQIRTHIDRCVAESEVFDPAKLEDYKAIQLALHGGPGPLDGEEFGFVYESVVVIHAEETVAGMAASLDKLRLYTPIWDRKDDELFGKDQKVHLYLYPQGALLHGNLPTQMPVLYTGVVEMINRTNARVQRQANCMIRDFARPTLASLSGKIPREPTRPVRQVLTGLESHGVISPWFYHRSSKAPRCTREVSDRSLSPDEQGRFASREMKSDFGRPAFPEGYTAESVDSSGRFIYTVPDEPVLCCVVSLPARHLYPPDVEDRFAGRVDSGSLFDEQRPVKVIVEPCRTYRQYVYRASYRYEGDSRSRAT